MNWAYLELGAVEVVAADPRGVLFGYKSTFGPSTPRDLVRIVPTGDTFVTEDTEQPRPPRSFDRPVPAPFERTSLGKKSRLAWPNGATAIDQYAQLGGWDERFAIVRDERGFSVIDAEADRVVRIVLPPGALRWTFGDPVASAGYVWLGVDNGVIAIPTAMVESLAAGAVDVSLVRHYPRRDPDARLECVFLWYLQDGRAMVEIGDGRGGAKEPKLTIDIPRLSLAKYQPVTLVDELYPCHYGVLEIPGQPRVAIANTSATSTLAGKVTSSRAKDPIGVARGTPAASPPRRASEDLDRLIASIVTNPDDDELRAVLVDLLLELGDPSAEAIAKLRADGKVSPARLEQSLGPLAPYLTKVELVGGFPVEATIAQNAPDDTDHPAELDAACADFRLAMIHTLHSQRGRRVSATIYARLVGAPRATALRRVDVSDEAVIDALIAANRNTLEYLERVDFAKAAWMKRLASSMFDGVTTVHSIVGLAHLPPLVNRLVKDKSKFFERAPRRLVLDETRSRNAELLREIGVVWATLPLAAVTIGGVTIERDGPISGDDDALVEIATRAFAG